MVLPTIAPNTAERRTRAMPSSCVVPAKIAALTRIASRQRQTNRFQEHEREHDPGTVLVDQLLHDGTAIQGMTAAQPIIVLPLLSESQGQAPRGNDQRRH